MAKPHSIRLTISFNSDGSDIARSAARNAAGTELSRHGVAKLNKTSSYGASGLSVTQIRAALDGALAEVERAEANGVSIDSFWLLVED